MPSAIIGVSQNRCLNEKSYVFAALALFLTAMTNPADAQGRLRELLSAEQPATTQVIMVSPARRSGVPLATTKLKNPTANAIGTSRRTNTDPFALRDRAAIVIGPQGARNQHAARHGELTKHVRVYTSALNGGAASCRNSSLRSSLVLLALRERRRHPL
jgi:hypothetical protein